MRKSLNLAAFLLISLAVLVSGWSVGKIDLQSNLSQEPASQFRVWLPERDFGYYPGDVLVFRAEVLVENGFILPGDAIADRRISRWLELRGSVSQKPEGDFSRYSVRLEYQVFYVPEGAERVLIPEFPLEFAKGERKVRVIIPEFGFVISSLTTEAERRAGMIADDIWPQAPDDARFRLAGAVLIAVGLALAALYLGPVLRRRIALRTISPFQKALRQISGARTNRELYRTLHGALNSYANRAVFSHELERLFREHPELGGIQGELTRFFRRSDEIFFADDLADGPVSAEEKIIISELLKKLAKAERKVGEARR